MHHVHDMNDDPMDMTMRYIEKQYEMIKMPPWTQWIMKFYDDHGMDDRILLMTKWKDGQTDPSIVGARRLSCHGTHHHHHAKLGNSPLF